MFKIQIPKYNITYTQNEKKVYSLIKKCTRHINQLNVEYMINRLLMTQTLS